MTAPKQPASEPEHDPTRDPPPGGVIQQTETPSPEAKAVAEPAREAVKEALHQIKTPEQAEQVAAEVVAAASGTTEKEIREQGGAAPEPAQAIQATAETTSGTEKATATLVEAAKQVAGSEGETREALELAVQEATNPEQQGTTEPGATESHDLLREAILKQMPPFQAVDAQLFLAVNHLPHTRLTNGVMYVITSMMNGGFIWMIILLVAAIVDKKHGRQALMQVVPPLWIATMTVEYPIKHYFRRRRPFVDVVQAIAVGKKPGTYSFPSGHSAAAFAGAWLLSRHYPRLTLVWYKIAVLVGLSRIFVGAHYPGDVLSGALSGTALAELTRWVIDTGDDSPV